MGFHPHIGSASSKSWSPAQLAGLTFMFDANDPRNALNSDTAYLYDTSGNGKHANKSAGKSRPTCTVEPLLNGAKVVRFDATQSLTVPAVARPRFILWLGRPLPGGTGGYLITSYGAGSYVPLIRNSDGYGTGFQVAGANISTIFPENAFSFFRPLMLIDGGTGTNACRLDDYGSTGTNVYATTSATDAGARSADGLDFYLNDPTFSTLFEMRFVLACNAVPSPAEMALLATWCRTKMIEGAGSSVMEWVGTLNTEADAQPRPYPSLHDGVSGQTLSGCGWLMTGNTWLSPDATIGSPSCPAPGSRGAVEALCTTQAKNNVIALWLGPPAVETQNPDITVEFPNCLLWWRRMFAVAGVGPGSLAHLYICPILPGLLAPYSDVQGAIWNAWASTTAITTLQGLGLPVSWLDLTTGFNTGTMLRSGDQHLSWPTGDQFIAQGIYNKLVADGYANSTYKLLLVGHSHVAGGDGLAPASIAQFRPALGRLLAA